MHAIRKLAALTFRPIAHAAVSVLALLERLADRIFGYDWFIAHPWGRLDEGGARTFAKRLYNELSSDYRCFLDSKEFRLADNLRAATARALRRSHSVIAVIAPRALRSRYVRREILLARRLRRAIVVIDINGTLDSLPPGRTIARLLPVGELRHRVTLESDDVGPDQITIEKIRAQFKGIRQDRQRFGLVAGTLVVVLGLLIAVTVSGLSERQQRIAAQQNLALAESRRLAALSELERAAGRIEVATILATEAVKVALTTDARSSLLAALQSWIGKEAVYRCSDSQITALAMGRTNDALPRTLLAAGTMRGDVMLCDIGSPGAFMPAEIPLHRAAIDALDFDPTGSFLASTGTGKDSTLLLWKVPRFGLEPEFVDLHRGFGWAVAFAPMGERLTCARANGRIAIGSVRGERMSFDTLVEGHWGPVFSLDFNSDGSLLVSAGADRRIVIWDGASGTPRVEMSGHEGNVGRAVFDPYDRLVASAGHDKTVRLWNARTGKQIGDPLKGHSDLVACVDFSPDGTQLVSASVDGRVIVWDVETQRRIGEPLVHEGGVTAALFVDESLVASAGRDGVVSLWRLTGRGRLAVNVDSVDGRASSIAFEPCGTRFAVGGDDGVIALYQARPPYRLLDSVETSTELVDDMVFSPRGDWLAAVGSSGRVRRWDADSLREIDGTFDVGDGFPRVLAVSPDGAWLECGDYRGQLSVWDVEKAQRIGDPIDRGGWIHALAFSADGTLLASGGDNNIELRSIPSLQPVGKPLSGHLNAVTAIQFQGNTVVTGSFDGTVRLWSTSTGEQIGDALRAAADGIAGLTLHADRNLFAASTTDGELVLWDLSERRTIGSPFRSHRGSVEAIAFSPDGNKVATVGGEGNVVIWDLRMDAWMRLARKLVRRNLTEKEWLRFFGPQTPYRSTFDLASIANAENDE